MAQFRWIIMSSFLMLLFQFRETAGKYSKFTVRAGDGITLSCGHVIDDQEKCGSISWAFSGIRTIMTLFEHGKINKEAEAKSDRLSVRENCSLVIKNVTDEDVGRYTCRQFRSGEKQQGGDTVDLSVVTTTEEKNDDIVTLNCSVLGYNSGCRHSVKWLYEGDKNDVKTTQHSCSATATFTTSHLNQKSEYYELLKCEVTEDSSGEKPGWRWKWGLLIVVAVAALLIITVAVLRWRSAKGKKQITNKDMADPEGGVSYASISYTKKTNRRAQTHVDDDDDDAVTYSVMKASSSSAAACADPSDLYATVNKPKQ
ncbi:uncharacterized protein LOC120546853 [Perca fluviatilis]|uniref:uncharacterized protein LOC120546853 n=1 Tax=Perca fluviatilis TaxID=8168 RepID=UPI001966343B|nr:uncharacterized protein LOC120546853 [Perca fluviatilis]